MYNVIDTKNVPEMIDEKNKYNNLNPPRAALYVRLSNEDRNKLTKEEYSGSIKNQIRMLKSYAEKKAISLLVYIMMKIILVVIQPGLNLTG